MQRTLSADENIPVHKTQQAMDWIQQASGLSEDAFNLANE